MKLCWWMTAKAVVEFLFGIALVLIPVKMMLLYSIELDRGGALMAQLYGTAFLFGSILLWLARKMPETDGVVRAIIIAVVVSNAIGFVVLLMAALSGTTNSLGWLPVLLYLLFGIAFGWFLFTGKSPQEDTGQL